MITDCYDPESEFERVTQTVLNAKLLTFCTLDKAIFQKPIARCEIVAILGAGKSGHVQDIDGLAEMRIREDCWNMRVVVNLFTESRIDFHRSARAFVRKSMAELPWTINGGVAPNQLVNYVVYAPVRHLNSTLSMKVDKGRYTCRMDYSLDISVHQNAWAKLNQET